MSGDKLGPWAKPERVTVQMIDDPAPGELLANRHERRRYARSERQAATRARIRARAVLSRGSR